MSYYDVVTPEEIEAAKRAYERAQRAVQCTSEALRRSHEVLMQSFKILGRIPELEGIEE